MTCLPTILNRRRIAAIGTSLAAVTLVVGLSGALARNDDGSKTFFLSSGLASSMESHAAGAFGWVPTLTIARRKTAYAEHRNGRLIARLHRGPLDSTALAAVQPVPGASTPLSIYTDRTLRRGDAFMTSAGIRIFAGATTFPYRDADFVALKKASGLPPSVTRVLASMDSLPRG